MERGQQSFIYEYCPPIIFILRLCSTTSIKSFSDWSISVGRNKKPLDKPKKRLFFRIIARFRIKLTKNKLLWFIYWSILMYYPLLSQKNVELINLSGPNQSIGRRNSADCKQRGTKWSAEGAERVL